MLRAVGLMAKSLGSRHGGEALAEQGSYAQKILAFPWSASASPLELSWPSEARRTR